ncbi:MAG TPA: LemA family protein [Acidimicrobiales bacterium]|nr:LemA family protein [Acidimicrobiales bacterium]
MEALTSGARSRPRWLIPVAVIGGIVLLLILPLVGSYNGMVDKEAQVDRTFADLDAQLQRRNDLIPNLVGAVRGALNQELAVFGEIARARQNYAGAQSPQQKDAAAGEVSGALGRLLVIMEAYPQLQSNQNIRDLQVQLEGTENRIAQARRDYNGQAGDFNRTIRRFPRSIFAGLFGFDKRDLFTAEPAARTAPTVDLGNSTTTTTR